MTWVDVVAGGAAGCVSRLVTNPLDVVKIRLQLQHTPKTATTTTAITTTATTATTTPKYRGVWRTLMSIHAEEGWRGLAKGGASGILLYVTFGAVQFSSYPAFLVLTNDHHGASGALAAVSAQIVSYPFDVLRTHFVAQRDYEHHASLRDAVTALARDPHRFFRGLFPTLVAVAPNAAVQFSTFEFLSSRLDAHHRHYHRSHDMSSSSSSSFLVAGCGAVAGIAGKVASMPFDTVKKRLQVQGLHHNPIFGPSVSYKGMIDCFVTTVRRESISALFKGNIANILKASLSSSITFLVYDLVKTALLPFAST